MDGSDISPVSLGEGLISGIQRGHSAQGSVSMEYVHPQTFSGALVSLALAPEPSGHAQLAVNRYIHL